MNKQAEVPTSFLASALPISDKQTTWAYAHHPEELHLISPDRQVFSFKVPEFSEDKEQVFSTKYHTQQTADKAKEGAQSQGTAQVHRSTPESIYVTLHDGRTNPTLLLKKTKDGSWFGVRRTKKATEKKAEDGFLSSITNKAYPATEVGYKALVHNPATFLYKNVIMGPAAELRQAAGLQSPWVASAMGLGLGAGYDQIKRTYYNTEKENEQEDLKDRALRYVGPAVGLGAYDAFMQNAFPSYFISPSSVGPQYKSLSYTSKELPK